MRLAIGYSRYTIATVYESSMDDDIWYNISDFISPDPKNTWVVSLSADDHRVTISVPGKDLTEEDFIGGAYVYII